MKNFLIISAIIAFYQIGESAPVPNFKEYSADPCGKVIIGVHSSPTAQVNSLYPVSPFEKAGGKVGDIIVKVGDNNIDSLDNLVNTLKLYRPGAIVKLKIRRGNKEIVLNVTLGEEIKAKNPFVPKK